MSHYTSLSRRRLLQLASAAGGAALASGMPMPAFAETAGSGKVTTWATSPVVADLLTAGFKKDFPNYDIECLALSDDDMKQRLVIAIQGGQNVPDAVLLDYRETGDLFATGQFMDMSAELEPLRQDFPDGTLVENDGKVISYIQGTPNVGLWVNRQSLQGYGLEIPADCTWDQVVGIARQLKQKSGGKAHFLTCPKGYNGFLVFNAYFQSRAGNWWDPAGKLIVDRALAVDTLKFYVGLRTEELSYPTHTDQPNFWDLVKAGTMVGFTQSLPIAYNLERNVPDQSGQWQLVTWPRWGDGAKRLAGGYGGNCWAAMANAPNPQGAKDVVMWWLSNNGIKAQFTRFGAVTYKPAKDVVDMTVKDPYFGGQQIIEDLLAVPCPQFNFRHWSVTGSAMTAAVESALAQEKTPEQAIDDALAEMAAA